MKGWTKAVFSAALLGVGIWIGSALTSNADGINENQPGSVNDPIVTKSYVDQAVAKLGGSPGGGTSTPGTGTGSGASGASLKVVELKAGHMLYAGEGTEFIVRTGKAIAFSSTTDGIPDLTAGEDIKADKQVPNNHLLLFPREGRGVKVEADYKFSVHVMVRGSYLHMDEKGKKIAP